MQNRVWFLEDIFKESNSLALVSHAQECCPAILKSLWTLEFQILRHFDMLNQVCDYCSFFLYVPDLAALQFYSHAVAPLQRQLQVLSCILKGYGYKVF